MRTLDLSEEQAAVLLDSMEATDRENEAMGVSGPEVAAYNVRVLRIESTRRHLQGLEREHAAHAVTQKITSHQARKALASKAR
jgi:hypothetical protein